jgi:hypothetical protein
MSISSNSQFQGRFILHPIKKNSVICSSDCNLEKKDTLTNSPITNLIDLIKEEGIVKSIVKINDMFKSSQNIHRSHPEFTVHLANVVKSVNGTSVSIPVDRSSILSSFSNSASPNIFVDFSPFVHPSLYNKKYEPYLLKQTSSSPFAQLWRF